MTFSLKQPNLENDGSHLITNEEESKKKKTIKSKKPQTLQALLYIVCLLNLNGEIVIH